MANKKKSTENTKKDKRNIAVLVAIAVILCIAISFIYAYMKGWFDGEITPTPSLIRTEEPTIVASPSPGETGTDTPSPTPTGTPVIEQPLPDNHIKIDKFENLLGYFEYLLSSKTGVYALSVYDITADKSFNISANRKFDNTAAYKLAVVMYAYEPEIRQKIPLDTSVEYTEADYDSNSDVVAKGSYSDKYTIQKLCEYVLKNDDRAALNMLLRVYGKNNIEKYMSDRGMSGSESYYSPDDMTVGFKLFKDKIDSHVDGYSAIREYLSSDILTGVSAASFVTKDKDIFSMNGSAMVYAKNIFIVSMSAKDANLSEAESTFKDICGIINTLFAKNAVIVEKSKYSHALILDNIDEKAKQTAEKLQSVIMYPDGTASNVYISEDDIFFPHSDEYSDRGITTYRGNNYRDSGFSVI